jgi:hypothetical protein
MLPSHPSRCSCSAVIRPRCRFWHLGASRRHEAIISLSLPGWAAVVLKGAYWIISNIAIAIFDFSLLLPPPFSYRSYSLLKAIAKSKGKIITPSRSIRRERYVYIYSSLTPLRA